jgi:putative transposase
MKYKTCRRDNTPGHAHELTFSCYRGLRLLSRDRTRRWLIEAIDGARHKSHFDLWAYVIMPEHAHILLYPGEPRDSVSSVLWRIKQPVGQKAIDFLERNAPHWLQHLTVRRADGTLERHFWQPGGGYDRNVVEQATLGRMIEYIHMNPVRRGLVERPEDWEWSSARWYVGISPVPLEIDSSLPREFPRQP